MILYYSQAGRIKQGIQCCRKFIVIFGSSDLFIEQCLLLWLSVGSFSLVSGHDRSEILRPLLTKFRQILRGNIDQYFFERECFRSSFTLTSLWLSAISKLDFLKSPGKSGRARPPRGMKLGNRNPTKPVGLIRITTYDSSERLNSFDLWNLLRTWDY